MKDVKNCSIHHNVIEKTHDGNYQIDGEIKYSAGGVNMLVLVECKHYTGPIEREKIQILHDKMLSINAQKGIFVSTSRYQSGAIEYANAHRIALLSVVDSRFVYHIRSKDISLEEKVIPPGADIKPYYMVMITQVSDTKTSFSIIDKTDELLCFINDGVDGGRV
jgi:hypothetical protein